MKTAIIGLPMTGKTSLFTILTGVHQETRIGSTSARTGVARVPDARLEALAQLFEPNKTTHATVEYVDMPSISKESLRDAGAVASLRNVDAFAHVLRLFADETIPHEKGSVDPLRDMEDLETELILSDLVVIEKRLERLDKDRKKIKNPELDKEFELLVKAKALLEENRPLRQLGLDAEEEKRIRGFQFLSQKPMLYVLNLGEEEAGRLHQREQEYRDGPLAGRAHTAVASVCGKIEAELAELPREEQRDYLASYGLTESGLERLITATYSLLGPDELPHRRRRRVPRLDDSDAEQRGQSRRRHPFRLRKEIHPRRSDQLEDPDRPGRLLRRARQGAAPPGRQGIHRQGRRRPGDPPRLARSIAAGRWSDRGRSDQRRRAGLERAAAGAGGASGVGPGCAGGL